MGLQNIGISRAREKEVCTLLIRQSHQTPIAEYACYGICTGQDT